jgi:hypothetical protein
MLSIFFDTMPSAPSRQARVKTTWPSSAMCSLNRMPESVLPHSRASAALRSTNGAYPFYESLKVIYRVSRTRPAGDEQGRQRWAKSCR